MAIPQFNEFCRRVCSVIRWKPAREAAWRELAAHLEDHAAALEAWGIPPEEAAAQAVEAMGDPYEIGHQLDRCYSPLVPRLSRVFFLLALAIVLLITLGTVTWQSYRSATENPAQAIKQE